ncbi:MAG: hypothetical protein WEF50_17870 [Myxococcota bacterium]
MPVRLYPRVAQDPAKIRLWLGVLSDQSVAPTLSWSTPGASGSPQAVRALTAVRPGGRVFTGEFEVTGVNPAHIHRISVTAGDETAVLHTRTTPARVPDDGSPLNVLVASCFHYKTQRNPGIASFIGSVIAQSGTRSPHLSLFLGDQVYLDLPTFEPFEDDSAWLEQRFEDDYVRNFIEPGYLSGLLEAAPAAFLPDDHEYWNNYPEAFSLASNTWTRAGRVLWAGAARRLYEAFQASSPHGKPQEFEVEPLAFFLADTRSLRENHPGNALPGEAGTLHAWVSNIITRRDAIGVVAAGQSFLDEATGSVQGKWSDYALADYLDYPTLTTELKRLPESDRPLLLLTGDVHYGRVALARRVGERLNLAEVISSPMSLVEVAGVDPIREGWASAKRIFGSKEQWPLHSDPKDPPAYFAGDKHFEFENREGTVGQRGDHVSVLSFFRQGTGVRVEVRTWILHIDAVSPHEIARFELR